MPRAAMKDNEVLLRAVGKPLFTSGLDACAKKPVTRLLRKRCLST